MRYVRKTSYDIKENFLENLLIDREVLPLNKEDQKKFYHPTQDNLIDYHLLDNIEAAADLIEKHIKAGSKIYLPIDCDPDGFTSSYLVYDYITINYSQQEFHYEIEYHIPEGKEHGLQTLMDDLTEEKKYDLIIVPDAGSNDVEECKILSEMGYEICILDHHMISTPNPYAIIVNNQASEDYENKMLSGVGVVYKTLCCLDEKNGRDKADDYLDIVALGQISDVMAMNTLENRFICSYGLSHIKNPFFAAILQYQNYSLGDGPLTQIGVAFYITPLINALIRVGSQIEKERLFQAFITPDLEVPSTKRGEKGQMETICTQTIRNCVNAKAKQNRYKDKAIELLDIQIMDNCLDENKILILNADELDVPNTLTGLCAMGIAAKYKKPVLLGRTTSDGFIRGSARGREDSELKDLRQFLLDSNLMEFAEGHPLAFGQSLKISNIDKLTSYANEKLANVNFNEGFYEADFVVSGNYSELSNLIVDLDNGKEFYGQGNKEPVIIIENITVPISKIQIIGKNSDTLKFEFNGITYVKFKASELIEQIKKKEGSLNIIVAGRANVNHWGGMSKPQILIDEIEFKETSIYDF